MCDFTKGQNWANAKKKRRNQFLNRIPSKESIVVLKLNQEPRLNHHFTSGRVHANSEFYMDYQSRNQQTGTVNFEK
jgi:hypothetical protein